MRVDPWYVVLAVILCCGAQAEVLGPVYPITEPDVLEEIQAVLLRKQQSGELAKLQQEAIRRSTHRALNPVPVSVSRTQTPRSYLFDPSIVVTQDIRTPLGELVVAKGTRINPLSQTSLTETLLFFDARDTAQLKFAEHLLKTSKQAIKVILTGGSVVDVQKQWQRRVYFDQQGALVTKLGIKQVPAVVTQQGNQLRIDEMQVTP